MRALILAIALCTVACKQPAPSAPPVSATFDERQACSADAECAVVEVGCCDHCNGGAVVGIYRDHAADVRREYTAGCRDSTCTDRGCSDATPICRQGRCGISMDGEESLPDLPAPGASP